jgi:hypothetical protein
MQQIPLFPPLWRVSVKAKPIDWFAVIADLQRLGWNDAKIADQINVSPNTVWSWHNEQSRPSYAHGELLLELWQQVTGYCEPPRR